MVKFWFRFIQVKDSFRKQESSRNVLSIVRDVAKRHHGGYTVEKAFKLDFENDKIGSLYVNCCGCSQTEGLHSFGPASKPHYLIHYVLSGKGIFRFHDKEYRLEAGYGFLIQPNELAFYQADKTQPWSYLWVGFGGSRAEEYLTSMGLSARHPIFSCDRDQEL